MKKVFKYMLLIPACIGMLVSCSEAKTDAKLLDGKWTIVKVNGEKAEAENTPTMEFNMADKKLHGNAGCNIYNATLTLDDKDISAVTIGQAMSTMMACPDMETEGKVLKSMEQVRSVKAGQNENEMLLVDAEGNVLFVLSR